MGEELNGGGGEGGQQGGTPAGGGDGKITLTQAELNAKFAEHKRSLQRELTEAKTKASAFETLQSQVSELLGSGLIDGVEDLAGFREKASQTLDTFKSEKQRAEEANKRLNSELEKERKRATEATHRYEQATIAREIADVAGPKASSVGALEMIQLKLASNAKMAEDGSVVVTIDAVEDGKAVKKAVSVAEAIAAMEAEVTKYAPLFKATMNSGAGGGVDGVKRTPEGVVDFESMSMEKFIELSQKSPELIEKSLARMAMR